MLNIYEPEESNPNIKQWVKDNFLLLCVRSKDIILNQQLGRRIPVQLKERVEKKLIDQKPIIKLY